MGGPAGHVHRVHDAHGEARAGARGAARTLLEAGERRRHGHKRREGAARVEARLAREPRIHDNGHARNGERRLRDGRGQDDSATAGRGERTILLGVYTATITVFLDDDSEGQADTRAFLSRRIDGIMRFEKAKAGFVKRYEHRPSLSRFVGRLRYPVV